MQLLKVNSLNRSQLNQIISLHLRVLNESILNEFGPKFLEIVYKTALKRESDTFLTLEEGGQIYGYCLASSKINDFYKQCLRKNFLTVLFEVIKACLKNPSLLEKVFSWIFSKHTSQYSAELQFIVVDPKFQGQGWGRKMINEINSFFKQAGISFYKVGTWASNENSNSFYKKLDFKFLNKEKILGTDFNFYLSPKLK